MNCCPTISAFCVPVVFDDHGQTQPLGPPILFDAAPALANWELSDLLAALSAGDRSHWLCCLLPTGLDGAQQYDVVAIDAICGWLAALGFHDPEQITLAEWASARSTLRLLVQLG